jgi:hypothetical protein
VIRRYFEDLLKNVKSPAELYGITAVIVALALVAFFVVILLFIAAYALLTS